jgi:hypothetical protein
MSVLADSTISSSEAAAEVAEQDQVGDEDQVEDAA